MSRLTIREVIEHCNRHTERVESHSSRMQLEETPIGNSNFMKQYWEHRQVAEWLEELQALKDKQEQGLLHEAKIANGTKIYILLEVLEDIDDGGWVIQPESYLYGVTEYFYGELGKDFFLTEAEAEEALAKMEVRMKLCEKCKSSNLIESENGQYCCNCGWDSEKGKYRNRQTNADRIRAMSDEELAEFIATLVICEICEHCGEDKCNRTGGAFLCTTATSAKMLCKWLKSEVKE